MNNILEIIAYPSGANKNSPSSFMELLRRAKGVKKVIIATTLIASLSSVFGSSIANASEKSSSSSSDSTIIFQLVSELKDDGSYSRFIERIIADESEKIYEINADRKYIDITNPFTKEKESIPVLIEQGHTQEELERLIFTLKKSLSLPLSYENIKKPPRSHGEIIFTTKAEKDNIDDYGYYSSIVGFIQIDTIQDQSKAISNANARNYDFHKVKNKKIAEYKGCVNTANHEIAHSTFSPDSEFPQAIQFEEARVRVLSFLALKDYMKQNPYERTTLELHKSNKDFDVHLCNVGQTSIDLFSEVYKKTQDAELPIDKTMLALYVVALSYDPINAFYNQDLSQYDGLEEMLDKFGEIPKYLQEKGRPTNFLENVKAKDLIKLNTLSNSSYSEQKDSEAVIKSKINVKNDIDLILQGKGNQLKQIITIIDRNSGEEISINPFDMEDYAKVSENSHNVEISSKQSDISIASIMKSNRSYKA